VRRADNLTTFICRLSGNVGASTSWNPQGLSRPVMGLLYIYQLHTRREDGRIMCTRTYQTVRCLEPDHNKYIAVLGKTAASDSFALNTGTPRLTNTIRYRSLKYTTGWNKQTPASKSKGVQISSLYVVPITGAVTVNRAHSRSVLRHKRLIILLWQFELKFP
jgi:hypothetical protein